MDLGPLVNFPCTVCCTPTSMWCSRCQAQWYCTAEHLQSDWPRHRRECILATHAQTRCHMNATPPPPEQRLIVGSALLFSPEEERPRIITVGCHLPQVPSQGNCPLPLVSRHSSDDHAESIVLTQGLNREAFGFPPQMWYSPTALSACGAPINPAICCSPAPPSTSYQQNPVATPVDAGSPAQQGYTHFPRLPWSRAPQTQPAYSNIDMQYYTQVQQLQGMGQAAQAQAQSQLPTQMTQVAQHPAMPTQYNPPQFRPMTTQGNAHPYVVTHIPQSQQQDLGTQGQVVDGQQQIMAQYAMYPYPVSYDGRLPAQYAAWAVGAIGHVPDGQTSGM